MNTIQYNLYSNYTDQRLFKNIKQLNNKRFMETLDKVDTVRNYKFIIIGK